MNVELGRRWNEVVKPEDEIWHLGDFALGNPLHMPAIFGRLNGTKHLVRGNHDSSKTVKLPWASIQGEKVLQERGPLVYAIHNPARVPPWLPKGTVVVHGHCHGQANHRNFERADKYHYFDVGVDPMRFAPVTLTTAVRIAQERDALPHML